MYLSGTDQHPSPRRVDSRRGITLVEVAMALGIIAFSMTTLLALMNVGLQTFQSSMEATVRADIARRVAAEFRASPFSDLGLNSGMPETRYFDEQGLEVDSASDAFLEVRLGRQAGAALPGTTASSDALGWVKLEFYTRYDRNGGQPSPSHVLPLLISDNGL